MQIDFPGMTLRLKQALSSEIWCTHPWHVSRYWQHWASQFWTARGHISVSPPNNMFLTLHVPVTQTRHSWRSTYSHHQPAKSSQRREARNLFLMSKPWSYRQFLKLAVAFTHASQLWQKKTKQKKKQGSRCYSTSLYLCNQSVTRVTDRLHKIEKEACMALCKTRTKSSLS